MIFSWKKKKKKKILSAFCKWRNQCATEFHLKNQRGNEKKKKVQKVMTFS